LDLINTGPTAVPQLPMKFHAFYANQRTYISVHNGQPTIHSLVVLHLFPEGSFQLFHYRFADSLWAGANAPAHKLSANLNDTLNLCTGRPLTESDDTRCCINTIWSPDDEQDVARNM